LLVTGMFTFNHLCRFFSSRTLQDQRCSSQKNEPCLCDQDFDQARCLGC
jgi:hypothetical protein